MPKRAGSLSTIARIPPGTFPATTGSCQLEGYAGHAGADVLIKLVLLSRVRRPAHVAQVLVNFRPHGYIAVPKKLKGRQSKHFWPKFKFAPVTLRFKVVLRRLRWKRCLRSPVAPFSSTEYALCCVLPDTIVSS